MFSLCQPRFTAFHFWNPNSDLPIAQGLHDLKQSMTKDTNSLLTSFTQQDHYIMASSPPSLASLAAEIRLQILECCPNVPTAASLARTSKAFYSTWDYYHRPICEIISKRIIECYDDAMYLAEIQNASVKQPCLGFKAHVSRILSNAKLVEKVCYAVPTAVSNESRSGMKAWPSPTERTRFFRTYYFTWTLTWTLTTYDLPHPPAASIGEILATASKHEICTVLSFLDWMKDLIWEDHYNRSEPRGEMIWKVLWPHRPKGGSHCVHHTVYKNFNRILGVESEKIFRPLLPLWKNFEGWKLLKDDHQYLLDNIDGS